jgi:type I restriction enzyme S subunit
MSGYENYTLSPVPWIKQMPEHWGLVRGKNLYQKMQRPTSDTDEVVTCFRDGTVTLRKNRRTTGFTESLKEIGYQGIRKGDLVIHVMDAFAGSIGVSDSDGKGTPVYSVCQAKGNSNNQYYALLLREMARSGYIQSLYRGIRERSSDFRFEVFAAQFYPVPPREEQDQIVRFLDWKVSSINRLINIKQEQLRKVKELLDRLFRDTTSKCSKKVKIKYLFELDDDFFVPDASESYAKAGMYNRGRGIFLREPCLSNELGDSQFQHIHSDRLMLSGQFAWEDAVYITQEKDTHGIASHRYYLLKPVRYIPVEYLWLYFLSGEGFFNLQQCSHGSAGRNRPLNIKEVLNLELPVPDDKEKANALNELVRDYMRLQVITEEEKKALLDFKTHLVADIVTGKIDVRGIDIPEYEFVDEDTDADNEDDGEEDTEEQED